MLNIKIKHSPNQQVEDVKVTVDGNCLHKRTEHDLMTYETWPSSPQEVQQSITKEVDKCLDCGATKDAWEEGWD